MNLKDLESFKMIFTGVNFHRLTKDQHKEKSIN